MKQLKLITAILTLSIHQKFYYGTSSSITSEETSQQKSSSTTLLTPTSFSSHDNNNKEKQITVEDTTCNVEQVEEANDSQLYVITKELKRTMFFRTFAVDLDHGCPLTGWKRLKKKKEKEEEEESRVEEETECASEGLPDFEDSGGGACSIDSSPDDANLPPWGKKPQESSATSTSIPPEEMSKVEEKVEVKEVEENDYDDDFDEEPFECGGDDEEEEELDTDEPLCSVQGESLSTLATKSLLPVKELFSSALQTLSEKFTWDSESQRNTYSWFQPSDPVILSSSSEEEKSKTADCDDDDVPVTFWMDMCSEIKAGDGLQIVNLELNPERNTGYNGTHIWKTIYEENCIMMDAHTKDMCYEERVLYRLLSGLHTSTTLSIATNYYPPSKRKNRLQWEPNPTFFYDTFEHHPEYIRNLHFSYLVLLRALRKAKGYLYNYEIRTGDIVEDEKATVLLRRLLDTHILTSCSDVFDAFDENLMFNTSSAETPASPDFTTTTTSTTAASHNLLLRQNFKGVFHNISSILDCVQCQQCKLHGKMAMLGYGTALKILFSKPEMITSNTISRNEVVAFINTICKFSESLKEIRMLTNLYWASQPTISMMKRSDTNPSLLEEPIQVFNPAREQVNDVLQDLTTMSDKAVSVIVELSKQKKITMEEEICLVQLALSSTNEKNPNLLLLVKYYHNDLDRLLLHIQNSILNQLDKVEKKMQELIEKDKKPDAIIIGGGLAGLVTAVQILDRGGQVTLIDKEHTMGGNSAKASSGMNGCCLPTDEMYQDTIDIFQEDTIKSAGSSAQLPMIETLVQNSARALAYLSNRIGIDLSLVAQLGGHSKKRTHRPNNGMVGAEVIYGMTKVIKEFEKKGRVKVLLDCKVIQLLTSDDDTVTGVKYQNIKTNETNELTSPHTILATGGFAHARSKEGSSLLSHYRPEYVNIPATAGHFSTGDGISLATTTTTDTSSSSSTSNTKKSLNANTIDMEHIQIHPTGWIDPNDEHSHSKVLAAELLRGVGGILLSLNGTRFCNEVGTRSYISDQMLIQSEPMYNSTKHWDVNYKLSSFYLLLSSTAATAAKKHVDLYTYKGLMTKIVGLKELAIFMNNVSVDTVRETLKTYSRDASMGYDSFGKTIFNNVPFLLEDKEEEEMIFHIGKVTPVLHYCMGGLSITTQGQVLNTTNHIIPGLHAVGEVSGGIHGVNRLAGNSLLECTVFGMIVGESIPIASSNTLMDTVTQSKTSVETIETKTTTLPSMTLQELSKHNTENDCWVSIHSKIYNLTEFALEHPAGPESIFENGGIDATDAFETVHNTALLDDFDDLLVGTLA